MSLFGKNNALEPLMNRMVELETAVDALERGRKSLDLEFTELYDKVSHQMSRMAKRHSAAKKINGEELPEPEPDDGLDPISRGIHQRRSYLRVKP